MEERQVKRLAQSSIILMMVVIFIAVKMSDYTDTTGFAEELYKEQDQIVSHTYESLNLVSDTEGNEEDLFTIEKTGEYIAIPKKQGLEDAVISFEDSYMTKSIKVTLDQVDDSTFQVNSFINNLYGKADIEVLEEGFDNQSIIFEIYFEKLYTYNIVEDEMYFYIELLDPKEKFDKIVVIDAGHGGTQSGTISADKMVYEKDINLSIVLYLKELLDSKDDIKAYYTRLDDSKVMFDPRVQLANELEADAFISIHCNGDTISQSHGTEALYDELSDVQGFNSKVLTEICLEELVKSIGTRNRGVTKGNRIYIIRNATVPVTLLEVAFMTNSSDLNILVDEDMHKKAAQGIFNGILRMYEERSKYTNPANTDYVTDK